MNQTLFNPGSIVATPAALRALAEANQDPLAFLERHLAGDWGEVEGLEAFAHATGEMAVVAA